MNSWSEELTRCLVSSKQGLNRFELYLKALVSSSSYLSKSNHWMIRSGNLQARMKAWRAKLDRGKRSYGYQTTKWTDWVQKLIRFQANLEGSQNRTMIWNERTYSQESWIRDLSSMRIRLPCSHRKLNDWTKSCKRNRYKSTIWTGNSKKSTPWINQSVVFKIGYQSSLMKIHLWRMKWGVLNKT